MPEIPAVPGLEPAASEAPDVALASSTAGASEAELPIFPGLEPKGGETPDISPRRVGRGRRTPARRQGRPAPVAPAAPTAEAGPGKAAPSQVNAPAAAPSAPPAAAERVVPSLDAVFDTLVSLLQKEITPKRPQVSAARLRSKLAQALGTFHERDYKFGRFKDFLTAAAKAGRIYVQTTGNVVWVSLERPKESPSTEREKGE